MAEAEQVAADRDDATRSSHDHGSQADGAANVRSIGAAAASSTRFDRLTKRHRDCLRGVRELKGSKEIADALGIEKSTVDSYLTEAVKVIGARNRRDAALLWAQHEAAVAAPSHYEASIVCPDKIGGHSARLSKPTLSHSPLAASDEVIVGSSEGIETARSKPAAPTMRLPIRRKGQRTNDFSVGDRLIWIQAIVLGIAVGFGMLMTGLQVLTGLIETVSRFLS